MLRHGPSIYIPVQNPPKSQITFTGRGATAWHGVDESTVQAATDGKYSVHECVGDVEDSKPRALR
eukprot:1717425-Pleurochrysis_carterae.AAC.1